MTMNCNQTRLGGKDSETLKTRDGKLEQTTSYNSNNDGGRNSESNRSNNDGGRISESNRNNHDGGRISESNRIENYKYVRLDPEIGRSARSYYDPDGSVNSFWNSRSSSDSSNSSDDSDFDRGGRDSPIQYDETPLFWYDIDNSSCSSEIFDEYILDVSHVKIIHMGRIYAFEQYRNNTDLYGSRLIDPEENFTHTRSEMERKLLLGAASLYELDLDLNSESSIVWQKKKKVSKKKRRSLATTNWEYLDEIPAEMNVDCPIEPMIGEKRDRTSHNHKDVAREHFRKIMKREPHAGEITEEGKQFLEADANKEKTAVKTESEKEKDQRVKAIHESLSNALSSVYNFKNEQDSEVVDAWMHKVESIIVFGYDINKAQDFNDLCVATISFAQKHCKKSISVELWRFFNSWNKTELEPQGWVDDFKELNTTEVLDLLRQHEMPKKICYLISAAMSICACEMKEIEWKIGGLELVKVEAMKQQCNAFDLLDAMIRTFVWCVETGSEVMRTGSLYPILFSNQSLKEYHENLQYLTKHKNDVLNSVDFDQDLYREKLEKTIIKCANLQKTTTNSSLKMAIQRQYENLIDIQETIQGYLKGTEMRICPFGVSLFGNTGVGKSTISKLTMQQGLAAGGYLTNERKVDWKRVITSNAMDKYDSNYFGKVQGMYLDDLANSKADRSETNPAADIIRFFNNISAQAVKAELNLKGVVFVNFKVGVVTTNKKNLDAHIYSNCPESILRRLYHGTVVVKPEYTQRDGIQLNTNHPDLKDNLVADAWTIKLEEVLVLTKPNGSTDYEFATMRVTDPENGRVFDTEALDIYEYLEVTRILAKNHFEAQKRFMEREKKGNNLVITECGRIPGSKFCTTPDDSTAENSDSDSEGDPNSSAISSSGSEPTAMSIESYSQFADASSSSTRYHIPIIDNSNQSTTPDPPEQINSVTVTTEGNRNVYNLNPFLGYTPNLQRYLHFPPGNNNVIPPPPPPPPRNLPIPGRGAFGRGGRGSINRRPGRQVQAEIITEIVQTAATNALKKTMYGMLGPWFYFYKSLSFTPIKKYETHVLSKEMERVLDASVVPWVYAMIPDWAQDTRLGRYFRERFERGKFCIDIGRVLHNISRVTMIQTFLIMHPKVFDFATKPVPIKTFSGFALGVGRGMLFSPVNILNTMYSVIGFSKPVRRHLCWTTLGMMTFGAVVYGKIASDARAKKIREEFARRRDTVQVYSQFLTETGIPKTLIFGATVIMGVKLVCMWNSMRLQGKEAQAITPEDVDKQQSWLGGLLSSIGFTSHSQVLNASPDHVLSSVGKNLFHVEFKKGANTGTCNIVFIKKYLAIIPRHIFHLGCNLDKERFDEMEFTVRRSEKKSGNFTFKISYSQVFEVPHKDMVMVYVPNCPDVRDISKWLPTKLATGIAPGYFVHRNTEGKLVSDSVAVNHCRTGHEYMLLDGGEYNTPLAKKGSCMSVIYAESRNSCILGFHIAGEPDSGDGSMQVFTMPEFENAVKGIEKLGYVISSSSGEMPEKIMDKPVVSTKQVHSCAKIFHNLPNGSPVDLIGSTSLRAQSRSQVEKSYISDSVEEHFGVSSKWGPPGLNPNWKAYNATMEHILKPTKHFQPELLKMARDDYLEPFDEITRGLKVEPLTDKEAIMGIDGARFIDALPMKTSMGFPVFGPKEKWFQEVRDGEKLLDRIPDPVITDEVARLVSCWKNDERAYPVCTATLKDEPTKIGKEKVRVFQASNVAMSLCIRKYFLPIIRFMGQHPIESESAVGVNAFGPQWQELMDHATKYGGEPQELLAGDYSKYDVRMSSQLTMEAWTILILLAEKLQYDPSSLKIMKAMLSDIIHPMIDWNGTMLLVYNMNTSGNNCTVQINDIVNSLLLRMGFFHSLGHENFRDHVSAITYGDDFIGSVCSWARDKFNFETFKRFLAAHDMKITLPDKTEEVVKFLPGNEVDFLKRRSNYIPEINRNIGALDEDSIFKSLHANLKSKGSTPKQVAISCVETAMHEWFAHGKTIYEDRRAKMQKVCAASGISVPAVGFSFEYRVDKWNEAYN